MSLVFKIMPLAQWRIAQAEGIVPPSPDDTRDGFIHLSEANQLAGTLSRHFAGQPGLVLAAFRVSEIDGLRWEASRGGLLFPHAHGTLSLAALEWARAIPLTPMGAHDLPQILAEIAVTCSGG